MKNIRNIIGLLICIMFSGMVQAQDTEIKKSSDVRLISQHRYVMHVVDKGQTLYAIAKAYNVKAEQIIADNPGAEKNVQLGDTLKICLNPNVRYVYHVVKKGETLWSIVKQYNVKSKDLLEENNIESGQIKEGDSLLVPVGAFDEVKPRKQDVDNDIKSATSENVEKIHKVEKGETLYAIAVKYNVVIDDIIKLNPSLIDGLKEGMEIKIPVNKPIHSEDDKIQKDTPAKINHDNQNGVRDTVTKKEPYVVHTVLQGETLYAISKKYEVSIEEIIRLNPSAENGVREGQTLRIPKKEGAEKDEDVINKSIKKPKEISGKDTLVDKCVHVDVSKKYKVALMIPLYLNEPQIVTGKNKSTKVLTQEELDKRSFKYLGFYEGALLAIDSLMQLGLDIDYHVYDTKGDTNTMKKLLKNPELKKMDLIIGPFFSKNFEFVSSFAKVNNIPVVSPFISDVKDIKCSDKVIKLIPSVNTQLTLLAKFVSTDLYDNSKIIIIQNMKNKGMNLASQFKSYLKGFDNIDSSRIVVLKDKLNIDSQMDNLLSAKNHNLIVMFSDNQVLVTKMLSKLAQKSGSTNLTLVGFNEWREYNSIELDYLEKVKFHSFEPLYVDYQDEQVQQYVLKFREKYSAEPDKYAFVGYDLVMYLSMALNKYGTDFVSCLSKMKYHSICTEYQIQQLPQKIYENKYISIYKIEDYKEKRYF